MSKELKAFKRIEDAYISRYRYLCEDDDFETIEKVIKVIEIIKEKLDIVEILFAIKGVGSAPEYDLVKEVLYGKDY